MSSARTSVCVCVCVCVWVEGVDQATRTKRSRTQHRVWRANEISTSPETSHQVNRRKKKKEGVRNQIIKPYQSLSAFGYVQKVGEIIAESAQNNLANEWNERSQKKRFRIMLRHPSGTSTPRRNDTRAFWEESRNMTEAWEMKAKMNMNSRKVNEKEDKVWKKLCHKQVTMKFVVQERSSRGGR